MRKRGPRVGRERTAEGSEGPGNAEVGSEGRAGRIAFVAAVPPGVLVLRRARSAACSFCDGLLAR